jgi:hypothetical protein
LILSVARRGIIGARRQDHAAALDAGFEVERGRIARRPTQQKTQPLRRVAHGIDDAAVDSREVRVEADLKLRQ